MWAVVGKKDRWFSWTLHSGVSCRSYFVKTKLIIRSHLLLHDDSISSRLISYILYLPNSPADKPSPSADLKPSASGSFLKGWDPKWGGSLELFPVENGEEVGLPGVKRVSKVDVSWGQIIFFEVKPGRSYHAVEEVIVGDGRQRLGVSGWYVHCSPLREGG
jgi:Rps23 Pro-64 3,4-dihydroxylase Tpa1-like proline 4-hydroxylase